jgi:hypothetical protein
MCIYRQNTTIFISSILAIYYITHNMFRPLLLAIFRLYMDLTSSYTTYVGCSFRVWGKGLFCGTEISFVLVVVAWSGTVSLVIHALV